MGNEASALDDGGEERESGRGPAVEVRGAVGAVGDGKVPPPPHATRRRRRCRDPGRCSMAAEDGTCRGISASGGGDGSASVVEAEESPRRPERVGGAAPPPSPHPPIATFYRREMPNSCVSFSSMDGRAIFASAMANGGTYAFHPLIEQLQTQSEPAYCGLTTLVVVLNALAVDPRRSWKGQWRWYEESMLNCCVDLESVKRTGISFATFVCLARCQGLDVSAVYGSESTEDEFRRVVRRVCVEPPSMHEDPESWMGPTSFLVVSYHRGSVGQTGTGHFSPVGAYDEDSDRVLVLDTARFKYGPHWVPLGMLFDAMLPVVSGTGKSRGYAILGYDGGEEAGIGGKDRPNLAHLPVSVLFRSEKSGDRARREYKRHLRSGTMTFSSVVMYFTGDGMTGDRVWELVEPQLRPVDAMEIRTVESLLQLTRTLIEAEEGMSAPGGSIPGSRCSRSSGGRVVEIDPVEAAYIVYLASLTMGARREVLRGLEAGANGADDAVVEQLLAEAALIALALETCEDDGGNDQVNNDCV